MKGLAIIGVIFHHLSNRRFSFETRAHLAVISMVFDWCVVAFIFLAGYLHGRSKRQESMREFLSRRARRLLVPYLWLGVTYAVLFQAVQRFGIVDTDAARGVPTLAGKLATLLTGTAFVGEQLYFFVLLFAVSLNFAFIFRPRADVKSLAWVASALCLGMAAYCLGWKSEVWVTGLHATSVVAGLFQYILGYLYARTEDRRTTWNTIALVALGISAGAFWLLELRTFLMLCAPLVLFLAITRLPNLWPLSPVLTLLGDASASIYAFHTPFILQPLVILLLKMKIGENLDILLSCLLTVLICLGIHRVLHTQKSLSFLRV